jgi:hypothetical protein
LRARAFRSTNSPPGRLRRHPTGRALHRHSDPNTATGYTSSGTGNSVFEQSTTDVPAVQGIAFGIRYRIENVRPGQTVVVEEIIRHPPIHKSDGTVISEEKTTDARTGDNGSIDRKFFYRLSQPYEVVAGDWSLSVVVNGIEAIDEHFSVRPAH